MEATAASRDRVLHEVALAMVRYALRLLLFLLAVMVVVSVATLGTLAYRATTAYTQPPRVPPTTTPESVGLAYEDVQVLGDGGIRLAAWYIPPRTRPAPALLLLHGIGANRTEMLDLAADLNRLGYALMLLDLRAHGSSEGTYSTLGVREALDVRAAVELLAARPEVDSSRLGIYGASLGAAVAIMAAAETPRLRAVVADSGFASIEWVVRHQLEPFVRLPAWMGPILLGIGGWQTGVDPADIAPQRRIRTISPRPILLIHGTEDTVFQLENARLLAVAAGEPSDLWIVPGAGHVDAYSQDPAAYVRRVDGFYRAALGVQP